MNQFSYEFREIVYVSASGSIDSITSKPLMDDIVQKLSVSPNDLFILDLQNVDFMNSLGLAAIIRIWKEAKAKNKTIRILTNPRIADIIRVSHLNTLIDLYVMESNPAKFNKDLT